LAYKQYDCDLNSALERGGDDPAKLAVRWQDGHRSNKEPLRVKMGDYLKDFRGGGN
jgi:hypothetical protein